MKSSIKSRENRDERRKIEPIERMSGKMGAWK